MLPGLMDNLAIESEHAFETGAMAAAIKEGYRFARELSEDTPGIWFSWKIAKPALTFGVSGLLLAFALHEVGIRRGMSEQR